MLCLCQAHISRFWKIYFKLIKYEEKWRENRKKNVFVIRRNKQKNATLIYNTTYGDWFRKINKPL